MWRRLVLGPTRCATPTPCLAGWQRGIIRGSLSGLGLLPALQAEVCLKNRSPGLWRSHGPADLFCFIQPASAFLILPKHR